MDVLKGRIQNYAWGSRTAIAELLGNPAPSAAPEAELWLGAHPNASSLVLRDGAWRPLIDVIAERPGVELGPAVVAHFGARLPFLLKVLAAETPLSLQAHPNAGQASAGFAAEETAKVSRDAPERNYKDASHKPELLCALHRFEAFCGFRRASDTLRLFADVGADALRSYAEPLVRRPDPEGLRSFYAGLAALDATSRERVVRATRDVCAAYADRGGEFARECRWVERLGALYPGDIGVVLALLLNLVELERNQAIYLPAGNLHAYLAGVGVEIMANSDNVLRGGLTPKHVDPPELLRVLTFDDEPAAVLLAHGETTEQTYVTPADEFRLSRFELREGPGVRVARRDGPEILLCVEGGALVRSSRGEIHELAQGGALFVPADEGSYELFGAGTTFRAAVGDVA